MLQTYTYRGKVFMYDSQVLQSVEGAHGINVLEIVRNGIDTLISTGEVFQRVTAIFNSSGSELKVEVKPV